MRFGDRGDPGIIYSENKRVLIDELRCAGLLEGRQAHFAELIAREGGKPLTDAAAEVLRAIDGLRNAAEELRNFAGREIPMGLTRAIHRLDRYGEL